jgi:hypothetical protein
MKCNSPRYRRIMIVSGVSSSLISSLIETAWVYSFFINEQKLLRMKHSEKAQTRILLHAIGGFIPWRHEACASNESAGSRGSESVKFRIRAVKGGGRREVGFIKTANPFGKSLFSKAHGRQPNWRQWRADRGESGSGQLPIVVLACTVTRNESIMGSPYCHRERYTILDFGLYYIWWHEVSN